MAGNQPSDEVAHCIDSCIAQLRNAGATGIDKYERKLTDNAGNLAVVNDLLFECRTALMFLSNGFSVDMRESPDLSVQLAGNQFYAEVKHFRLKEQDRLDEANLEAADDLLVPYGDTVSSEGEAAWDQVVQVAKHKINQYHQDSPNILVIGSSSSYCIDDAIMPTAINIIAEEVSNGNCVELGRLSGILLISMDYSISKGRNVFFFQTQSAEVPLTPSVLELLNSIRTG